MKNAYKIINFAKRQGFDLVGFTNIKPKTKAYNHYLDWRDKKFNAGMSYMSRDDAVAKRKSAAALLENAKTVICLAINYYHTQSLLPKDHGRIARYAFGRDYHKIIKPKLKKIEDFLQAEFGANTLSYVDTGPILERTLAEQAGLGFIGRNSCLITKEFGSYVLLAEIITDAEIKSADTTASGTTRNRKSQPPLTCETRPRTDSQPVNFPKTGPHGMASPHSCGTCTRCIDACPTGALTINPKTGRTQLNAKKCLSYLTIEHKGPLPPKAKQAIKQTRRIFGCDICQEACPHNCRAKPTAHKEFTAQPLAGDSLPLAKIASIKTDEEFLARFAGSPLMRAKRKGLQRNARAI